MITVPHYRLAYMAVPKAACTSVKQALARIDPDVSVPPDKEADEYTWHGIYPTKRFRPHRWEETVGFWRFTVIRDPVKRLLSAYLNRVVDFRELHNSRKMREERFAHLSKDPDPDFFFQNLDAYKDASSVVKHHTVPMWLFTGKRLELYDRIYTTADIPQLATDLSDRVGQEVTLRRWNASGRSLSPDDLAPATRDILRAITADDYDLYADFFTPYI